MAKIAHRESLAKAVTEHPHSADMMFLLAVVLYCDDDPQRSQAFFQAQKRWNRAIRRTSRAFSTCWLAAQPSSLLRQIRKHLKRADAGLIRAALAGSDFSAMIGWRLRK